MTTVYVVVATSDSEIEVCETFTEVNSALGRGFQLATNKDSTQGHDWTILSPSEEKMLDGSSRWVFMDTSKQKVVVFHCKVEEAILSAKDPLSFTGGSNRPMPPKIDDDFFASVTIVTSPQPPPPDVRTLPGSWFLDGKPAVVDDLEKRPNEVLDPLWDLNDNHKWALAEAIYKRTLSLAISQQTKDILKPHLDEIKARSQAGHTTMKMLIDALHRLRMDAIANTDHT